MKINQELEKTIVDTQHKYKDTIFLNVTLMLPLDLENF